MQSDHELLLHSAKLISGPVKPHLRRRSYLEPGLQAGRRRWARCTGDTALGIPLPCAGPHEEPADSPGNRAEKGRRGRPCEVAG